jgi:hypothetical protein
MQLKESFKAWATTLEKGSVAVAVGAAVTVAGTSVWVAVGGGVAVGVSAGTTTGGGVWVGDAIFAGEQPASTAEKPTAMRRMLRIITVPGA